MESDLSISDLIRSGDADFEDYYEYVRDEDDNEVYLEPKRRLYRPSVLPYWSTNPMSTVYR